MRLGKTCEVQQLESRHVAVIVCRQSGQHIIAMIVPRGRRQMRMPRCDDLESGKGWIGNEALVRIDVNLCGMIDSDKPRLVKIVDLLHGLRKSKAETTVARLHARAINFDVLVRVRQMHRSW